MKTLVLAKKHAHRVLQGHDWIYSNEVDAEKTPLKSFQAGEVVQVSCRDQLVGVAYINPHSLIAARLLTRQAVLPKDWIFKRIESALQLRQQYYALPYYRLVFAESDGLPGLIVDRFGDDIVMQINTAGMEQFISEISEALVSLCAPKSIWLQADSSMRSLENLPSYQKALVGEAPEHIQIIENDVSFYAPLLEGQKTGWFYDHRENRAFLKKVAKDKTVLDLFSYVGGWGIQAACAGAQKVVCVDASKLAVEYVQKNAALNKVADRVEAVCDDVFDALSGFIQSKQKFDVIVLDPPAFIKRRKDLKQGLQAYYRVNQQALKLLNPNSILVSASCSQHLSHEQLQEVLRYSYANINATGRILYDGQQGPDHPVHLAMPETDYLKAFFVQS